MSKEVLLIFQDCPYCAPREKWGKRQMELAEKHNIVVREARYDMVGVDGLIQKAHNMGISTLPFFTDGKTFGFDLSIFVKAPVDKSVPKETVETAKAVDVATTKRTSRKKTTEGAEVDGVDKQD